MMALLLLISVLVSGESFARGNEWDLNRLLNKQYRVSTIRSCLQNKDGFNENFFAINGAEFRNQILDQIKTYYGDGTGWVESTTLNVRLPSLPPPPLPPPPPGQGPPPGPPPQGPIGNPRLSRSSTECPFTYVVNPDRSFTETYGTCTGTILTGSLEGEPFTVEGVVVQGQIVVGLGRRSLVYNDNATNLVTITVKPGEPGEFVRKRICGEIGNGVRIFEFGIHRFGW
jgi:hypothetical protein